MVVDATPDVQEMETVPPELEVATTIPNEAELSEKLPPVVLESVTTTLVAFT